MSSNSVDLNKNERLLEEFAPHSYEDWRAAAEALLKGASFEKKLVTKLHEGITLQPIYREEDIEGIEHLNSFPGSGNYVRGNKVSGFRNNLWNVSQELDQALPEEFNKVALDCLHKGQNELNVVVDKATASCLDIKEANKDDVGFGGVSISSLADMEAALKDIVLDAISVHFQGGLSSNAIASMLFVCAQKNNVALNDLKGCIANDPFKILLEDGTLPVDLSSVYDAMAELTKYCSLNSKNLKTICVDGQVYSNGGASAVQELGYILSTAVEYIREMLDRGLGINEIASSFRLSLTVSGNYFMEIAKIRAARVLWAKIIKEFGGDESSANVYIHARTARWNKTKFDPYVNMLRCTTEAFSAVVGGCDGLHVSPFDEIIRSSDEFSRRISRNIHFILGDECDLKKIIDPAGGSWYIEWLTDQVAKESWKVFQEVESDGGMLKSIKNGLPQSKIEEIRLEKVKALSKRKEVLVGTNMYPNSTEELLDERAMNYEDIFNDRSKKSSKDADVSILSKDIDSLVDAVKSGATVGTVGNAIFSKVSSSLTVNKIEKHRAAENFEELKLASMKYKKENGNSPRIFQANIGPSRFYRARADWTSAFFQVGGFEVMSENDFDSVNDAVNGFKNSNSEIVIITSTDDTYTKEVPSFAKAIKEVNSNAYVIVAGVAGDNESSWREAGVDDFVNVRVNNYEMLNTLLKKLGAL